MAVPDEQCSLSTSILSSIIGLIIGGFIGLVLIAIHRVVKSCIAWRRGRDGYTGIEDEINLPESPRNTPPTNTPPTPAYVAPITTVTTVPGHAVSDMDRDINSQITHCQELQELEAGIYWNHTGLSHSTDRRRDKDYTTLQSDFYTPLKS